jgi:amidase
MPDLGVDRLVGRWRTVEVATVMGELVYRSARQLHEGLRRKDFSARELLAEHLGQIERRNPAVNAIVTLDVEGAQKAAADADQRCATGGPLGPLHGLPIAFKDTHDTAGLRTTYGSPLFADHVPDTDSEIVRRVLAAGAIRIGKTNVPEFATGSHTFNRVFGLTRNPYALDRSAGGSSGGAAAALATGMQPVADGGDMGGSLRNPASFCNVVGLRPTPGLIASPEAMFGYLPLSVDGPMARTVDDVAMLLHVMAGPHRDDPLSFTADPAVPGDARPTDLAGLRVAWAPTLGGRVVVERGVLDVLDAAVRVFERLGATVEPACPDLDGADAVFRTLRAADLDAAMGDTLIAHPAAFKPDLAWNIRQGSTLTGRDVVRAGHELTRLQRAAHVFFDRYDVLLAPASQVAPFDAALDWPTDIDGVPQRTYLDWMAVCYLITTLGVPAISVPGGFSPDGLPIGLQIVTAAHTEAKLLAIAATFEAATNHGARRPPTGSTPGTLAGWH